VNEIEVMQMVGRDKSAQDMEMERDCHAMSDMKFYPVTENWTLIKRYVEDEDVRQALNSDFNKYTMARFGKPFGPGQFPADFEDKERLKYSGNVQEPFRYVKMGAAHWTVNFSLMVAMRVAPEKPWCIIRTLNHSSVWDGENTVFDIYGMAFFELGAPESFIRAVRGTNSQELEPGELLKTYPPAIETKPTGSQISKEGFLNILPPGAKIVALGVDEESVTSPPMAGEADAIFSQSYTVTL
jgi:hypothetical protein